VRSTSLSTDRPIYVLNGPNLNRLGEREPEIYGSTTLQQVEALCRQAAGKRPIEFRQTNHEGQIVDWIHEAIDRGSGIVINPAGYSFTSVAILDALKMFPGPIVEVHITNIHRREALYHRSLISKVATAVIAGLGARGYAVAVRAIEEMLRAESAASVPAPGAPPGARPTP
jgi:3-dehydroquinate dehydratase II